MTAKAFVDEVIDQFPDLRLEIATDRDFLVRFGAELDADDVPQLHVWNVARMYGERARSVLDDRSSDGTQCIERVFDLLERALTSGGPDMDIAIGKDFFAELLPEHTIDRPLLRLMGPATSALVLKTNSERPSPE